MHLPVFSDSKHCLRGMQMCMCTHEYTCRYQRIPVIVCAGKCTASMDTAEIDGSAVSPKSAGSTVKSISTDPVKSPDLQGPLKIAGCQRVSSVRSSSASVWRSVDFFFDGSLPRWSHLKVTSSLKTIRCQVQENLNQRSVDFFQQISAVTKQSNRCHV